VTTPASRAEPAREPTHGAPVRIAYIGGWGRSGSTLLARMLGEVPRYVNVGEIRDLFMRGIDEDRVCGCGVRFSECPFWTDVGETAFNGWDNVDLARLGELRQLTDRPWHVPALLRPGLRKTTDRAVAEYGEFLVPLYRAMASVADADVVIDSSKYASFAAILRAIPSLDPRVVHLVRDPRGTLNSWMKEVRMSDDLDSARYMPKYSVLNGGPRYLAYNLEMHAVARGIPSTFMRYEDLIEQPTAHLRQALEMVGVGTDADLSEIAGPQGVQLGSSHTVMGNPMRHQSGWIPLRADEAWKSDLGLRRRIATTATTLPLIWRYRYEL